jgi:hypothetical protein
MSWYNQGFDGIKEEEKRQAAAYGPGRFKVPVGERREMVFIDDEPAQLYEHNPKMNGNWQTFITCLKDVDDPCPVCETLGEKTRYYVGIFTVVDTSKWKDKKGNDHQYEINFCAAKFGSMKKLRRKKEDAVTDGKAFVGALYRASRDTDKEPAIGSEFEYVRAVDMDRLFEVALYRGKPLKDLYAKAEADPEAMERLKDVFQLVVENGKIQRKIFPFNYFKLLHPKPRKELVSLMRGTGSSSDDDDDRSGGGGSSKEPSEDTIPF